MQPRHLLQFECLSCQQPVRFSVFELEKLNDCVKCTSCHKKYAFQDETLRRQLRKFEALCRQIVDSEEILSHTAVGIDIGEHHVKVPYKLLLTRLNSMLDLTIGDQKVSIVFRIEPLQDLPVKEA
ncbi:MAG: hypothetical protein H0X51_04400 [Parachlamydiaceae bacterium]|nr:hypothetical protein [Parachlamydiaceae bacterium]